MFFQHFRAFWMRSEARGDVWSAASIDPSKSNLDKVPLRIEDPRLHDHTARIRVGVSNANVSDVFDLARDRGWGCQSAPVGEVDPEGLILLDLDAPICGNARTGLSDRVSEVYDWLRRWGVGSAVGFKIRYAYVLKPLTAYSRRYRVYRLPVDENSDARLGLRERAMIAIGRRDTGAKVCASEFPVNLESYHLPSAVSPEGYTLRVRRPVMSFRSWDGHRPTEGRSIARRYLMPTLVVMLIVVAGICFSAYTMPIASRGRAFRLAAFFFAGGIVAITGIPQYIRGKVRTQALLWCVPLALPVIYPITIVIGKLRLAAYLQNFGLSLSDVGPNGSMILSAALGPVAIAVFCSLIVVGIFGWIRYFVHRDWGMGVLMLITCVGAYFVASVQLAVNSGDSQGARAVAAVSAGRAYPALYGFTPDLACISPLKTPIAIRGSDLMAGHLVYVFSLPRASEVALWDSRSGKPTWVYASDVRILDVTSKHVRCPPA